MKLSKLLPCLLSLAVIPAFASATTAVPKKVGPVNYYGALHTSGGKIIGEKNNQEVMLRGMSLFWSDATGLPYYKKDVISWAVDNLKMDVFRFAMGITCYSSTSQKSNGCVDSADSLSSGYSYATSPDSYKTIVDRMVEAAVENDVYIIIDWHSHRAEYEQSMANSFFKEISAKYANIPNVIYEIYNEPVNTSWGTITSYANQVVSGIRANTQNLVLVGTPSWSQLTSYGGVNGTNIGYVFHFYAGTHKVGSYGSRITAAKNSGSPVFITEWGTVNADGAGSADQGATSDWMNFMEQNKISNCNWSLRQTNGKETSGMFDGSTELSSQGLLASATYSTSGNLVKQYLTSHGQSWADSLIKGKNTGSCAFKHAQAKETDGQLTNALKSGCTYTSSNENVVTVSGSTLEIKGAGYAILTGNDGSQSVVTIHEVAKQTIPNFTDMYCRYNDADTHPCSIGRGANYSGSNSSNATFDWILGSEKKTLEGATYTLKALNPDIVDIKTAKCTNSTYCSSTQKEASSVIMLQFKKIGEAKFVATAPAVTGYTAMNDTITVTYRKGENKLSNKIKDMALSPGATAAGAAPDKTLLGTPMSVSFNGEATSAYITKSGTDLVAGTQNAIIYYKAYAEETDVLDAISKTVTIIIGDSASAVNKNEYYKLSTPVLVKGVSGVKAQFSNNGVVFSSNSKSPLELSIFNVNGEEVFHKTLNLSLGSRYVSLTGLKSGSYIASVKQDGGRTVFNWNKK